MADVFVSYKKDDRAIAERLVKALNASGRQVWWDDALSPNEAWDSMIEKEIAAARAVLVLWSPRSVQSDWVRSEAHYAQDHHKLIPVMIEPCSIPLAFMLRQAVDLSAGKYDESNPNWEKLLAWLDAVGTDQPAPDGLATDAAAAAVPIKAISRERWLGPSSRPGRLFIVAGLVAVLALTAIALHGTMGFGQELKPDVYLNPIAVAQSPGIPVDFSQAVSDEITTQLNAASRVTPLESDGRRHAAAYQMSGNVRMANGKLTMFAKIFAPGIAAPVLSPRIEVPEGGQSAAAKYLGGSAASLLRCIATASDSSSSEIVVLPEAAMRPWAQYCQNWILGGADFSTMRGQLELVVKAAPDFANGWSTLAEYRGIDVSSEAAAGPVRQAYEKALALDPDNPKATIFKALDVIGLQTNAPLRNLAEFERLATKANEARPSDCGCEAKIYRDFLTITGRLSESLPHIDRIIANDPGATFSMRLKQYILDALGRSSEAKSAVDDLNHAWPGSDEAIAASFHHALVSKDWVTAKAVAPKLKAFPGHAQVTALIDAIQSGDRAGMDKNVAPLLAALANPDSVTRIMLTLVAATGHEREVAAGFIAGAEKYGAWTFLQAWAPELKAARAQPEFIALVKKYNLAAYWRLPGHRPDICEGPDPEPVCNLI